MAISHIFSSESSDTVPLEGICSDREGLLRQAVDDLRELQDELFLTGDSSAGLRVGNLRVELQRLAAGLPLRREHVAHAVGGR